ncbi:unnamed protein product, partial [Ceratitis capitata]
MCQNHFKDGTNSKQNLNLINSVRLDLSRQIQTVTEQLEELNHAGRENDENVEICPCECSAICSLSVELLPNLRMNKKSDLLTDVIAMVLMSRLEFAAQHSLCLCETLLVEYVGTTSLIHYYIQHHMHLASL